MSDPNEDIKKHRFSIENGNLIVSIDTEPFIPTGSRDPKLPTSITSGRVTTPLVDSNRVHADDIIINNKPITDIAYDLTDNDPDHVASAYAMDQIRRRFLSEVKSFKNQLNNKIITPVISAAITPPYFSADSGWEYTGVEFSNGQCMYRNNDGLIREKQATMHLGGVFGSPGSYFIIFSVNRIDSGNIVLYDNTNKVIRTIEYSGEYVQQIEVEDHANFQLFISINNVSAKHIVIIDRIYIYHVEQRAVQYFNYLAKSLVSGDETGIASMAWVNNALATYQGNVTTNVNAIVADLTQNLLNHAGERNPHHTTYADVGAAPAEHTHTVTDFNAAPKNHTHTPDECGAAAFSHMHIPSECGAAAVTHLHEPEDCGAAPYMHTHSIADITDDEITTHITNYNNPHKVYKNQVGLGDVENYSVATDTDFINRAGDKYVTPKNVGNYLDIVFSDDPTLKYVRFAPKQILERTNVSIDPDETYEIEFNPNCVYTIYIDCKSQINANCFGIKIPIERINTENNTTFTPENMFLNSWMLGNTDTNGNSQMRWWYETGNAFYLLPKNVGNNILKGRLTFDTSMYTLIGDFQTWLGEMQTTTYTDEQTGTTTTLSSVNYLSNVIYPLRYQGTLKGMDSVSSDTAITTITPKLIISHDTSRINDGHTNPMKFDITILEFVAVGTPANPVDTVPIMTIQTFLGDIPPAGWHKANGDILDRSKYEELAANIIKQNRSIPDTEYIESINTHGMCNYFVLADDAIRLPSMPSIDGISYIIKTHMSVVE